MSTIALRHVWLVLSLVMLCAGAAFGQEKKESLVAIKAARLIDGTGNGVIQNAVVLVRGEKIELVGREKEVQIPREAKLIDLGDQTLLPGLIDTQGYPFQRPDTRGYDGVLQDYEQTTEVQRMGKAIRNVRTDLLTGVTTVRVAGEVNYSDVYLAEMINSGIVPGPRILASGLGMTTTDGTGPPNWRVDGLEDLRKFIRENLKHGAHQLKLSLQDISPEETRFTEEELKAVVREIRRHDRWVSASASGPWGASIKKALEAGIGNIENPSPLNKETIQFFVKHKGFISESVVSRYLYFVDDLWDFHDNQVNSPKEWIDKVREIVASLRQGKKPEGLHWTPWLKRRFEEIQSEKERQQALLEAHKAGVPVTLGLGNAPGLQSLQVEYLVEAGFSPVEAIAAVTSIAAKSIGMGDQIGTIEEGKVADIISVKGDPVKNIQSLSDVDLIMVRGKNYSKLTWR